MVCEGDWALPANFSHVSLLEANSSPENDSRHLLPAVESAQLQAPFLAVKEIFYKSLIPAVFCIGVVGNLGNLLVYSRKRFRRRLDDIEKSATAGFIFLSVSDLLMCLTGAGILILHKMHYRSHLYSFVVFLYDLYRQPVMNFFIFTSTWFIVALATERYVAVCHPFHARDVIRLKRSLVGHSLVVLISAALNAPLFLKYTLKKRPCFESCICYYTQLSPLFQQKAFMEGYRIFWAICGTFLPFLLLLGFNIRLLVGFYRSRAKQERLMPRNYSYSVADRNDASGLGHSSLALPCLQQIAPPPPPRCTRQSYQRSSHRVTKLLVLMVALYLLLVCPSSILEFLRPSAHSLPPHQFYHYQLALVLSNLLQAIKFSSNFFLYCCSNPAFRNYVTPRFPCAPSASAAAESDTSNRYRLVEI